MTMHFIRLALTSVLMSGSLLASTFLSAQEFVWAPEFPVGTEIPEISAQDQNGNIRNFADLVGENGMLFMLSRSFDWCPFCTSQLTQLIEISEQFETLGISVVAMTYDSVELLKEAELDHEVEFTLLHDDNITHVNALGILNTDYEPDSRAYGVPYPGIFLLDSAGVIRYKFAEESYRDRPDFTYVLEAASEMVDS